ERMGMTPLDYLTLLRSERAKVLLEQTDMSIRDISLQVGYYDSGSFIRRFKQVTGETPLQYRRGHGGKTEE
ncbi:MAG: helix-turn-helix transcriptional regulator, partial [Clostridia bacterium]|nr:helix-turn-helix transcriptional regulator [Clostridia bacterium]